MIQQILSFFQLGIGILLGTAILLQRKGAGLGGAFGGEGGFYHTKRGFEKTLLIGTIILASLFIITGIVRIAVTPELSTLPVPAPDSVVESSVLETEEQNGTIPISSDQEPTEQ